MYKVLTPDCANKDSRGFLVQLIHDGWEQVNVISSKKGQTRGGHWHEANREAFYIIKGSCQVTFTKDGEEQTHLFKENDFFMIEPGVAHTFYYLEDTTLVSLYSPGVNLPGGGSTSYQSNDKAADQKTKSSGLDILLMSNNIQREDITELIAFLSDANRFTNGPKVTEFEQAWSQWLGVKHTVFVNSGASANFITMAVIRDLYGAGEIIVPPLAWSSDISAVFAAGHKPVFVDINKENLAMREEEILSHITRDTKAVFLTHVLGFNGLTETLVQELQRRHIPLIEDVCESHGAAMHGRKCGTFGLASNFSFYYAHHMSTIEGGAICTNDDRFYQYCRLYRSHGMVRESTDEDFRAQIAAKYPELRPEFLFLVPGYNMRSTELNAVIGLSQLKRLDANNERRKENLALFLKHLDPQKYYTDFNIDGACNYAFVVLLREPDEQRFQQVTDALRENGVEFRRGTAGGGNLARQPFVRARMPGFDPATLTNADFVHFYGLYTGNYPDLSKEKILALCELLNKI